MAGAHDGHRERMTKIFTEGTRELNDMELFELLLYPIIPRKNTVELAHALLSHYKSIFGVLCATVDELLAIPGVGETVARAVAAVGEFYRLTINEMGAYPRKFVARDFINFVRFKYRNTPYEVMDVYFLKEDNTIVDMHRFTSFAELSVGVNSLSLSALIAQSGRLSPWGVILVHNHPDGGLEPSEADERLTDSVRLVCRMQGKAFLDHYICSREGVFSCHEAGLLDGD